MHAYKVVSLDSITPYDKNARTHSDEQIEQIRASIKAFGFTNPLLVDEYGLLIAGHGRLIAARLEGLTELPAIIVSGLSSEQRRALIVADNKIATNAGWDFDILAAELDALNDAGFDLALTGFSQKEIDALIGSPDVPEIPDPTDPSLNDSHVTCPKCAHVFDPDHGKAETRTD
jgi:ParB-like chromosome segregation protein Spo0J